MKLKQLGLKEVYLIENFFHEDERGKFVKMFHKEQFEKEGINDLDFREMYYSQSKKNTIRGMHFQMPPSEHSKLIYLTSGEVIDVLLDLRKDNETFGSFIDIHLKAHYNAIYIPRGIAHGFKTLSDDTTMIYNLTSEYDPDRDMGIYYDSFGYNWNIENPIVSDRDKKQVLFNNFKTPF